MGVVLLGLLAGKASGAAAATPAMEGIINVKAPYNLAYELAPIEVELGVKNASQHELKLSWHVYDMYKNEVAKDEWTAKLDKGQAIKTVSFTPPRFGWYAVQLQAYARKERLGGWQKHVGVTPRFPGMIELKQGELRTGWNDEALQAFSGLMLDHANTRMGLENAERVLADTAKYGVTLLMQFDGPPTADEVRKWVTRYKGRIKYWEVVNEPNFSMGPQQYADVIKRVYPIVKEIDPAATVMGPGGIDLGWYAALYDAGGGKYLDVVSIHDYEGNEDIDPFHWTHQLTELRKLMVRYGDADKPLWQTERAISGVRLGFVGPTQAVRMTLQRDLLETFGIPNNHNNHYYAAVTGDNAMPTFVFSDAGPHPAALACRTRCAMTLNRTFTERIDFGPIGNQVFLGLRYQGKDGATVTLRNLGCLDHPLEVFVKGGDAIEVVDAFGNAQRVPLVEGQAVLTIAQMPSYVRLTPQQELTIYPIDFGRNLASEAKYVYSGESKSDPKLLYDGLFQNHHPSTPWGPEWQGAYKGKVFNDKPETFDMVFDKPRLIQKLLLFGVRSDNLHSALLDYDLQYQEGSRWITVAEVRTPCPPTDLVESPLCKWSMWYLDNNCFVHEFAKPVKTDKLRLVVRRITRGCLTDMIAEDAANEGKPADKLWHPAESLQFRELEIYGPPPPAVITAKARAASFTEVNAREPLTVSFINRTDQSIAATAVVVVPAPWKAEPAEFTVSLAGLNQVQEQKVELVSPPEILTGDLPVQVTLKDAKGETLGATKLILGIAAPLDLRPETPKAVGAVSLLPLTVRNHGQAAVSGTAKLELTVYGQNTPPKTIVQERNYGPLQPAEAVVVEFQAEGVDLAKSAWIAAYRVPVGKFLLSASFGQWCWQVVGPFPYATDEFNKPKGPEGKEIDLTKTYGASEKKANWKPVMPESSGLIDFIKLFDPHENVCAYAVTWLKSPGAQEVVFAMGSDDGIKVWLNGKVVHANDVNRGATRGSDTAAVTLQDGWNEVLVRINQGGGGWGFYFDLRPAPGKTLPPMVGVPNRK
jgi:hypothetical protein